MKVVGGDASVRHVLLIYRRMIPSIRLCSHCQMEALAAEGRIAYRARKGICLKKEDLNWADVALLGRLDSWYELQIVKKLRAAGKTLVYIMDDDLLHVPAEVTSASYYNQPEIQDCIRGIIDLSDAVLSPSPLLLKKYAAGGKKAIRIEEPAIHPAAYRPHDPSKPVKIGFAGSVDRLGDLERILREALLRVKQEYREKVSFEFFGTKPSFSEELDAKIIPYTESYDAYWDTLNGLSWDIGLAPMPETPFHACKHYNKFVEYAAAGIAGVYSNVPPYDRLAAFQGCALLCDNKPQAWYEALRFLIEDGPLREKMKKQAAECAAQKLSVRSSAETIFREIQESPQLDESGSIAGALPLLKVINLFKRFRSSVRGHGFGGMIRMMVSRAVPRKP